MLIRSLKVQTFGFAILLALSFLPAPLLGNPQGQIAIYQSAIGKTSFALSLTPGDEVTSAKSVQVVVLFDTSASQTGLYRTDALAALETFLGSLTPVDRVRLVAVDLEPVELTNGFVAPNGGAIDAAVSKLKSRAPLGATDMGKLLKFAAGCFVGPAGSPRCTVYIGDGLSKANYLDKSEFAGLMKQMVERRVAFSSYVIGPLRDIHLVAAIVNNTGGMMYVDTQELNGTKAGNSLASVVRSPVVWPKSVKLPKEMKEFFPHIVPPLRFDRDTIVIGSLEKAGKFEISMVAEINGEVRNLTWRVSCDRPNGDLAFLPQLIELARTDNGMSLPTVGMVGLKEARRVLLASARSLSKLSSQVLASGNKDGARKLAEAALRSDPENTEALRIRDALRDSKKGQKTPRKLDGTGAPADLRSINRAPKGAWDASHQAVEEDVQPAFPDVEMRKHFKTLLRKGRPVNIITRAALDLRPFGQGRAFFPEQSPYH